MGIPVVCMTYACHAPLGVMPEQKLDLFLCIQDGAKNGATISL